MTRKQDHHSDPITRFLSEPVMTLREAAESLGTSPDNLRGALARGTLRGIKPGRDWLLFAAEVERYRAEHRRPR
jgi:excisionase family DNA binding protein